MTMLKIVELLKNSKIPNLSNQFTRLNAKTKKILLLGLAVIITLSLIMASSSLSIPNKGYVAALLEKDLIGYSDEKIILVDVFMDNCETVDRENARENEVQCIVEYSYKWFMETGWITGPRKTKVSLHEGKEAKVFYQVKVKDKWRWRMD
jgi:hypothetical protein